MIERDYSIAANSWREPCWPDYLAASVADIDFNALQRRGIRAVMIDLDDTVVMRGKFEVSKDIMEALSTQPLPVFIATNRPKSRDLKDLRKMLNANGVIHPQSIFGKPSKRYYQAALMTVGLPPHQVAMVGDRLLQDTFGARRAGLVTVAVAKLGKPQGLIDGLFSAYEAGFKQRLATKYYRAIKPGATAATIGTPPDSKVSAPKKSPAGTKPSQL